MTKPIKERYLTTDTGMNIDKRIEDKKTAVFDNYAEAKAHAEQQRSYHYPIFEDGKSTELYGVPK